MLEGIYGADLLNKHLAFLAVALFIVSQIFVSIFLMIVSIIIYLLVVFRIFSKHTSKRFSENQKYLEFVHRIRSTIKDIDTVIERKKSSKTVKCPNCRHKMLVKQSDNAEAIRCKKCSYKFTVR